MQRARIIFLSKITFFSEITVQDLTEINPFMPENDCKNGKQDGAKPGWNFDIFANFASNQQVNAND